MRKNAKFKFKTEHWKYISLYLVIYDIIAVNLSYMAALMLRFDFSYDSIPREYLNAFIRFTPFYTAICLITFLILHLYRSIWRFASFYELNRVSLASVITTIIQILGITIFIHRMPISYYIMGALIQFVLMIIIRFGYRFINMQRNGRKMSQLQLTNVMVIGAGAAGRALIRELNNSTYSKMKVSCVIDDNENKWNRYIEGVRVVGGRTEILKAAKDYDIKNIFFAIPTATAEERRQILHICKETDCELKSLPGMYQLANGDVLLSKMKPVQVEELLGRDVIKQDLKEVFNFIQGKVILVTGGGGSIGSELCRQIANHQPKQLIIFDIYENNAYAIEQELRRNKPELNLVVLIGSVRDTKRINGVFEKYCPQIVYHAAAHKHVPLMEVSPNEAIKNNVMGTYKTAYAAIMYGTERFVLISTDKAVNPTNIMGASKRLCEMVIQSMDAIVKRKDLDTLPLLHSHVNYIPKCNNKEGNITNFAAVRFGNVLGSNGSVVPLFKEQILAGGPVTVTHPDIIRYFMTIPEAVSLVLQAGTLATGGEIYVLDMGEPVKIVDLAKNLIRLSGYKVDEDIKIEYTGLRPGEKLFEEKLMAEEGIKRTKNDLIHIGMPIPFDINEFLQQLQDLSLVAYDNSDDIVECVEKIVTTFHPSGDKPLGGSVESRKQVG